MEELPVFEASEEMAKFFANLFTIKDMIKEYLNTNDDPKIKEIYDHFEKTLKEKE